MRGNDDTGWPPVRVMAPTNVERVELRLNDVTVGMQAVAPHVIPE